VEKVAVIFNPEKVDAARLQKSVNLVLSNKGIREATYLPTTPTDTGRKQAEKAVAQGATLILAVGGDGTIRAVVEGMQGTDASLGIIPRGTGNALARNLAIPLGSVTRAVERAVSGNTHTIDLGQVTLNFGGTRGSETHIFAVMAGAGLDAKVIMNTSSDLKRKLGWVAYIDGGLRSLPVRFERMDVSVNGRPSKNLKVHSLLIGNCGFLAGNITLMPDARLDDGLLDVAYVGPRRFWNWIDFWNRVTFMSWTINKIKSWRKITDAVANVKTLENLTGKRIEVWPEHPVDIQLDGDGFGKVHSAVFDVLPDALKVRI